MVPKEILLLAGSQLVSQLWSESKRKYSYFSLELIEHSVLFLADYNTVRVISSVSLLRYVYVPVCVYLVSESIRSASGRVALLFPSGIGVAKSPSVGRIRAVPASSLSTMV